jgi:hypothetical protein
MKQYYLYRHVRNDINEPFYIGIGTCQFKYKKLDKRFDRAYRKASRDRSTFWHNIVNKTSYSVEIIFLSSNIEIIKNKETEFIKLYGRKDLRTGSLVNLTFGNEGNYNTKPISLEVRKNMSRASPNLGKTGFASPYGKHVHVYDKWGKFVETYGSVLSCSNNLNIPENKIREILKGNGPLYSYKELIFFQTFKGQQIQVPIIGTEKIKKPVALYDRSMNLIKTYTSIGEAASDNNLCMSTIRTACKTLQLSRRKQFWRFVPKTRIAVS